jgi:hypothetical protein
MGTDGVGHHSSLQANLIQSGATEFHWHPSREPRSKGRGFSFLKLAEGARRRVKRFGADIIRASP